MSAPVKNEDVIPYHPRSEQTWCENSLSRCSFSSRRDSTASVPAVAVFLEICMSMRCTRTLGGYLLALACARPTRQHAALPSQPLTLQLALGKICFESPHHQRLLRRLMNLSRSGQATKRQLFPVNEACLGEKRGRVAYFRAMAFRSSSSVINRRASGYVQTGKPESAGINRHVVGDARALQERK